jgi:pyruvate formate lyase activating enzyme
MTSPVAAILPDASMVDFPGRLAAVLFLPGCPFRCGYCHNPELWNPNLPRLSWTDLDAACRRFRDNWTDAAVITGGEPTLSPDLPDLVARLKRHGLAVKLDTNGSNPDLLASLLPSVDYVAMDIKCPPADYPRRTGFSDLPSLERSIALVKTLGPRGEFRTTVLPAWHTPAAIQTMAEWVHSLGDGAPATHWYLQPFPPPHPPPPPTPPPPPPPPPPSAPSSPPWPPTSSTPPSAAISDCRKNFPTIGKIFSNHWKNAENFFQSLEKPGQIFQPLETFFPIIGKLPRRRFFWRGPRESDRVPRKTTTGPPGRKRKTE